MKTETIWLLGIGGVAAVVGGYLLLRPKARYVGQPISAPPAPAKGGGGVKLPAPGLQTPKEVLGGSGGKSDTPISDVFDAPNGDGELVSEKGIGGAFKSVWDKVMG